MCVYYIVFTICINISYYYKYIYSMHMYVYIYNYLDMYTVYIYYIYTHTHTITYMYTTHRLQKLRYWNQKRWWLTEVLLTYQNLQLLLFRSNLPLQSANVWASSSAAEKMHGEFLSQVVAVSPLVHESPRAQGELQALKSAMESAEGRLSRPPACQTPLEMFKNGYPKSSIWPSGKLT
jgi:hypothetical protein